ncbi:deoxyuridine 5'-triphosphate nucleotidohydrolase [Bacillus thuringiensis]|uniref:dUTP diphosphatase n=2 Tax=Bacillus thuringiensis TaxID=1428 RepID=A0A242VXS3_BACTU|nr:MULTISPECIES: aminotransferase [Bacillus cereus group]MED3353368.1 deoxyuridine 5'-triphosphate nucleotidohydrolase [Bacillus thuringiensis]MEB9670989.1 deoxyuridine 5'-triphosphate nucleotidohydrolase [Bacillus anthracis]OTW44017.1 deoxyuridine 5'-triphosphate nucleotidohydrolase [Bacillus thuringiensis serovar mexicanensis]OTW54554.1 deoxyuridine 5'-triphosphate nucleotidohydrolase [Bacillus thuringiensis serovar mexicanensis]OTW55050.1 deoxyuridine 5'-triphosphate nucleotidohydrolase [Ba
MNLRVKIKRVKDVELPRYAKPGDSGFDLVAAEDTIIQPDETKVISTGLAFEIPPGYELQVRPRSGISRKTKLRVVLGTVDSGFRGEVGVIVDNISDPNYMIISDKDEHYLSDCEHSLLLDINGETVWDNTKHYQDGTYIIRKGERIAQGVIAPVITAHFEEADELSDSERGTNGYGSTGTK